MPQDNRTAGGLDQAMYTTDAEYEAAQEVAAIQDDALDAWAAQLKERFMNAATGKEVLEMPVTGGPNHVVYIHWRELFGDFTCSSSEADIDEPAEIAGLCAAGKFPEAQLRSMAMLKRCADWYAQNFADDTFSVYEQDQADNAGCF